jgi:curved DNA-binding protein
MVMISKRDYYQALDIDRNASKDDIQRAYRKLARRYHPDVNKSLEAANRFREISEAYDVLSDPETRRKYDAFGPGFRQVPDGVDPQAWAQARAGATAGSRGSDRGVGGVWFTEVPSDAGRSFDLNDLFADLFGGERRGGRTSAWGASAGRHPIAGADQEAELTLTVEEAYRGGRRSLTFTTPDGPKALDVTIPPGVIEGQRIWLPGQGGQGSGGAVAGDLYLVIRIAPHGRYQISGRDLTVDLALTASEAALGTSVPVETPDGEATVKVPPGTSTGRRLRLRGRGMPNPRGIAGDLYAEVKIMVPTTISDAERRLYQQLAEVSPFDPRRPR